MLQPISPRSRAGQGSGKALLTGDETTLSRSGVDDSIRVAPAPHDETRVPRSRPLPEVRCTQTEVTPSRFTAVARSLQEKGYIRYRRGQMEIVDREGLEACACECYDAVRRHYERLTPPAA